MTATTNWQPSADLDTLRARAALLADIRAFFAARGVMEVQTPVLSRAATVDRHIDSFVTRDGWWLQTSPEFAMKRLLAAGSGPIFQLAPVFRVDEQGRYHNPEFTLLEWYRPGFDHHALMDEVQALLQACGAPQQHWQRLSYREAYQRHAGFDPFALDAAGLRNALRERQIAVPERVSEADAGHADFWLDLAMSSCVGPALGRDAPCFLYDFPASQAALSRVRPGTPALAERFELFWNGIELANGFHELADAAEQQRRFVADQQARQAQQRVVPPYDKRLIAALDAGLPDCAGVAIGFDRLLMQLRGLSHISEALSFGADRA